jgi:hypothetical protein
LAKVRRKLSDWSSSAATAAVTTERQPIGGQREEAAVLLLVEWLRQFAGEMAAILETAAVAVTTAVAAIYQTTEACLPL